MLLQKAKAALASGGYDGKLAYLCACPPEAVPRIRARLDGAFDRFGELFGAERDVFVFSAPGRTEIGGNHTDHQRGRVLAAAVNLSVLAVGAARNDSTIRVHSEVHDEVVVDLSDPEPRESERFTSLALVRGVAARFIEMGYGIGGFDAYTTSEVLSGSGLSSSAAFEVLIGTILSQYFCSDRVSPLEIAQIGQYAENVYFGKPSGLMDQAASSIGGFVSIDFGDPVKPKVEKVSLDFDKYGYSLCILDTHGSHADLTPDYAAVPVEMKSVAAYFGRQVLREVDEAAFYSALPALREKLGDRPVLRAMHFFAENARAPKEAAALKAGDFGEFRRLVIESGRSSFCYLQNVYSPAHPDEQGLSVGLALCERLLVDRKGAWRVHGGGFAGTVQAFVPNDFVEEFRAQTDAVFGAESCRILKVRPVGGARIF